jgi:hypothetical protein
MMTPLLPSAHAHLIRIEKMLILLLPDNQYVDIDIKLEISICPFFQIIWAKKMECIFSRYSIVLKFLE